MMNPFFEPETTSSSRMTSMDGKIAVVGMACRFPGGANNPEAFWNLLKRGECTMEEVPPSRFNINDYWSRDGGQVNKMMARKGHFLHEGTLFDEAFFNISPREALNTDPQHRVLLEAVVDGLDDAGYKPSNEGGESGWAKFRMAIFVGCVDDSYQNNLASNIDPFFCPGTIRAFASGRISHYFGWQGPSIVYDTACSASLVAVHSACQSLLLHECDAAVASGTNMITSPEVFIGLSKGFFLSNTGGCKTFDETADGYCRAEGVGVLVLKRLADAVRDNDKIDAIILACGTNQSGPAESLTQPHAPTQAALFAANCAHAGISPLAVRVVEAHGTGTQAGDYAEVEAVKEVYCCGRPPLVPGAAGDGDATKLFLSSLKPNVGHSESASGLSSMIKAVLMMKHRQMLPHIGITTRRNPRLGDLEAHGIVVPTMCQPLKPIAGQEHIIISVSNFGAAGGNTNVILQESHPVSTERDKDPRTHHIIGVSAKARIPFSSSIERLLEYLETAEEIGLGSLSYTTTARRMDYPLRLALSVSSIDELKQQLKKLPSPVVCQGKPVPRIGFVLGGNGSQYKSMGKTLYETSPTFRRHIDHCDAALKKHGGPGVVGVVAGVVDPLAHDYESLLAGAASIFSVEYSLGMMWQEWGVTPSVIIAHSMGEFAGLALAGCLSVEDAMKLIVCKVRSVHVPEVVALEGGMLALGTSVDDAQRIIEDSGSSEVSVACANGNVQTCLSGPKTQLLKIQYFSQALPDPPLTKLLPGHFAWHSSHMDQPAAQLEKTSEAITFTAAQVTMILNTDGSVLQPGDVPPTSYLAQQMKMPVRFDLCATHPLAQDVDIWIELSAKAILLPLLRQFIPAGKLLLPTLGGATTECWSSITKVLARLYEMHVSIDWAKYHKPYPVRLISLPSYPFTRNEHWVPYQDRLNIKPHTTVGDLGPVGLHREIVTTPLGSLEILTPWRRYILHTGGHHLSPGAYLWLALSCTKSKRVINLRVTDPAGVGAYLTVLIDSVNQSNRKVSFVRHDDKNSMEVGLLVASCGVESGESPAQTETEKLLERSRIRLSRNPTSSFFSKAMVSKMLLASKDTFGTVSGLEGQLLESLVVSDDGEEAVGNVHWHGVDTNSEQQYPSTSRVPFSPSQLRALLQPACLIFFLSPAALSSNRAYSIDQFEFMEKFAEDKTLTSSQTLCVHTFLDLTLGKLGRQLASAQSYVYSQSGEPLVRIIGFRKLQSPRSNSGTLVLSPIPVPDLSLPSSPGTHSSSYSYDTRMTTPITPPEGMDSIKHINKSHTQLPLLLESLAATTAVATMDAILTADAVTAVLAQELGIPEQSISAEDGLEDIGVDSIMSLLLRDKLSNISGHRLNWFTWKRGMTVQDLWDYAVQAAQT